MKLLNNKIRLPKFIWIDSTLDARIMQDNMDRVGTFVDKIHAFYDQLWFTENSVFLIEENREYESIDEVKATITDYEDNLESLPVVTIDVNGKAFRVFVKPMDAEAQIISRLSNPNCGEVVKRFREYILCYDR